MHRKPFSKFRAWALTGVAIAAIAGPASAEEARTFTIPSQSLVAALEAFGKQGDKEILFSKAQAEGRAAPAVTGTYEPQQALAMLLNGSGLKFRQVNENTYVVESADPQSGSAAGAGADGTVAELIVTAQKREENIQDVPIAISAFSEKSLQEQKIEGGFDLLKAIPNVTFSKNNFTSYNFSIRGIGTKAVSATTDPAVAVSFNNIALLQNRLFEQEYFDVERVEVLRGPQGTLYGRNATAGVINVISAKPDLNDFDGWIKGEVGNYHSKRLSAMVNIPLVEDKLAIRFAGALTDRQGYDFNATTKHAVNGRDLWSGRITVGFEPTEWLRGNLIWERFNEDDNRSRTGKQLCHHDAGLTKIGDMTLDLERDGDNTPMLLAVTSQGCLPGSLYDDGAFGTPNGLALPFVFGAIGVASGQNALYPIGYTADGVGATYLTKVDPYGGLMQSRDLRVIQSIKDPVYRAKADILEFNIDVDLSDNLTISSQTAYNKDQTYSFQDYNRFNTGPIFNDTSGLFARRGRSGGTQIGTGGPSPWADLAPGGVFCDPQIGCSNSIAGFDIAQAKAEQFTQEIRISSSYDGPVNFSLGGNYTRFRTLVDYYVFFNVLSAIAQATPLNPNADFNKCYITAAFDDIGTLVFSPNPSGDITAPGAICPYIDPNPIESLDGNGHNYFRSKNPYVLKAGSLFGEVYWQASESVKLTAGLRYNDDRKVFTPVPSQTLTAFGPFGLGTVSYGYPEGPDIKQHWKQFTGRLGVDWKPKLSFTDQTMVYAFYSRGYKGGGANPPGIGFNPIVQAKRPRDYGPTFEPEFVNAFELGTKNILMQGGLTLNAAAFYYDYKNYQVSQIKERTAVNENFNATTWGLEFQSVFSPSRDFQILANVGYLDTKIADGETSIDIMNRTQGNPNYVLIKPWVLFPSNCIAPVDVVTDLFQRNISRNSVTYNTWYNICGPNGQIAPSSPALDPTLGGIYDPANYPEINGGAGILADLGGNELPNAPHWTMNVGAQYGHDILDGSWRLTVRGDAYWQSQSWARVYNDNPYDKLHGWYNVNLSLWIERPEDDLKIELYAKNLLDKTPITDAFLNSDDTGLTTNVFVLDPRLIGLSIKKGF